MQKLPAKQNFSSLKSNTGSFVNGSMIPNYYKIFKTWSGLYEHPVHTDTDVTLTIPYHDVLAQDYCCSKHSI